MKVLSVESPEPTVTRLHILIPAEEITAGVAEVFSNLRATATVPGFRPRHIPRSILLARYGKAVKADALQDLVPTACAEAIESRGLTVVGDVTIDPPLEDMSIHDGSDLTFTLDVEVKPDITIPDYKLLEVDKTSTDVPREDVDKFIEALREERATYEDVDEDRPVSEEDVVAVDWIIRSPREDKILQQREDDRIAVGDERTWEPIRKALVRMNIGESKELTVPYPTQTAEGAAESTAESVTLSVTAKKLIRKILPEVDDAFAESLNMRDVEQMRGRLWNQLIERSRSSKRAEQERDLLDQLIERTDFAVPERTVEDRRERLEASLYAGQQRGNAPGHDHDADGTLTHAAERLAREEWLLDDIAKAEGIAADPTEVVAHIRRVAENRGEEDPDAFHQSVQDANMEPRYERFVRDNKVYDFLIERATQKSTLIVG